MGCPVTRARVLAPSPQIAAPSAGPRVDPLGPWHYAAEMRRGDLAGPESSPDREPSLALALRHSPARQRLCAAEREHERLLNEIRKKKAARETSESTARDAARALDARLGPLRDALCAVVAEVQAIFTSLLGADSRLSRRDKVRVRRAYGHLLPEREAADEAGPPEAERPPCGGTPGARRRGAPEAEAGYSAPKPKDQGPCLLRSLFRKLAIALHPDKEQDPKQRATLTSVMKEVTHAYEIGDVARLVELDRSWLAAPVPCEPEQDVERSTQLLLQANQELRRQLRALSAEVKSLRDSVAVAFGPARGGRGRGAGDGGQDWLLSELERELTEMQSLRDFARAFLDGDVSLSEFLLGPPSPLDEQLDRAEQFLFDAFADWPCGGSARARRRR
jgi:hypothetical protein